MASPPLCAASHACLESSTTHCMYTCIVLLLAVRPLFFALQPIQLTLPYLALHLLLLTVQPHLLVMYSVICSCIILFYSSRLPIAILLQT
jgi:hypothetical protein